MRLCTIRTGGATRAGLVEGDRVVPLDAADVGALLAGAGPALAGELRARASAEPVALDAADLAPVVPAPPKILCVGQNYLAHIREMGAEPPEYPTLFAKYANVLVGPRDPIRLGPESDRWDWEAELAIVVGRRVRRAGREEAAAAIAGFTVCNDVTARDWQRRTSEWLQGKTWESTMPLGPVLVTSDEVDGARDLAVRCTVDGEVVQDGRTSDLVFAPADVVAYASTFTTLEPGDVIATGTPSGVGAGRTPPVFLRPGQEVRTFVEGIGELCNVCVADVA